jgi:hypothetical protein
MIWQFTLDLSGLTKRTFQLADPSAALTGPPYLEIAPLGFAVKMFGMAGGYFLELYWDHDAAATDTRSVFLKLLSGSAGGRSAVFKTREYPLKTVFEDRHMIVVNPISVSRLQQEIDDDIGDTYDKWFFRFSAMDLNLESGLVRVRASAGISVEGFEFVHLGRVSANVTIELKRGVDSPYTDDDLRNLFKVKVKAVDVDIKSSDLGDLPWWVDVMTGGPGAIVDALEAATESLAADLVHGKIANSLRDLVEKQRDDQLAALRQTYGDATADIIDSSSSLLLNELRILSSPDRVEVTGMMGFVHQLAQCAFVTAGLSGNMNYLRVFRHVQKALDTPELEVWWRVYQRHRAALAEVAWNAPALGLRTALAAAKAARYVSGPEATRMLRIPDSLAEEFDGILEAASKGADSSLAQFLDSARRVMRKAPGRTFAEMIQIAQDAATFDESNLSNASGSVIAKRLRRPRGRRNPRNGT